MISYLFISLCVSFLVTAEANSVRVNKSCFTIGEAISITFQVDNPRTDDWVGIYDPSVSVSALPSPSGIQWLWTCGGRSCTTSTPIKTGTITYRNALAAGSWKIVLTHDEANGAPYAGLAQSSTFTVRSSCSPAPTPVRVPTPSPGSSLSIAATVSAATSDIRSIIIGQNGNQALAAKFLRLIFHDCVGGCDGCVDLTDPDNFGLLVPIQALRPVVSRHAKAGFTRADVWALAAVVGVDVMQPSNRRINFNLDSVGRVNCEVANTVCRNAAGTQQACSDIRGPARFIPGMNTPSRTLFSFFSNEFGFSIKETVAIMGAHTIGSLRKENSGVDGPNGWLLANTVFDNGYYHELIGGTSASQSLDVHVNQAPGWQRGVEVNNPNGIPNRNIWVGFPGGTKIVMLNIDIGLVRLLDSSNMDSNGRVSCTFRRTGACPVNNLSIQFAIDYTFDNLLWLNDFRGVLSRMLKRGYTKTSNCDGSICLLRRI